MNTQRNRSPMGEKQKYKAIVWDLDGTLLNTLQDLTDAVNHSLAAYELPLRSIEEVRAFVGNGIRNLIDRAVPAGTDLAVTDKVFGEFRTYYAVHCNDKTAPLRGDSGTAFRFGPGRCKDGHRLQ